MIKIEDLRVDLDGHTILEKLNLCIEKGKKTVIVGDSGSGKSVLVKTIIGLLKPNKGLIEIEGIDTRKAPKKKMREVRKCMSMLFQGSALLDSMNVYQNVALPLFEHKKRLSEHEILRKVKEKLALVGLENVLEKMPSQLSGGMSKRVALARAIILNPQYIIYDEPTTGLDPISAMGIIKLINKIQSEGNFTSVIITHDKVCVEKTAQKIAHLTKKRIDFYENPKNFIWTV